MTEFRNVSIMLGVVDETDTLRQTVLTLLDICDSKDLCEILICCAPHITDDSRKVVDELLLLETDVPVIAFTQKRNKLAAFVDTMEICRGSHTILVASDMALDLSCVVDMIEKAKQDGDRIVSSSRWMKGCTFVEYGTFKKMLNFLAQQFLKILYGAKLTDFTNPCQIVPTELYQAIKWENEGFPILIEMVLKPLRLGYRFIEVPTNCYPRKQGKSSNSRKQTAMYFNTALHVRFMKKKDILKKDSQLYKKMFD